jgi:hypothetical protein
LWWQQSEPKEVEMSDFRDPMYRDPNFPNDPFPNDPLRTDPRLYPVNDGSATPWGWIIGAFFLAAIVVYAFTMPGSSVRTASTPEANPPAVTRMAPTPPAPPAAQPFNPAPPPSTGAPTSPQQ